MDSVLGALVLQVWGALAQCMQRALHLHRWGALYLHVYGGALCLNVWGVRAWSKGSRGHGRAAAWPSVVWSLE